MPYSEQQVAEFYRSIDEWTVRGRALSTALIFHTYRYERSHAMAAQSFTRRLHTLVRCIERVYELVPPEAERPLRDAIDDAAIWLQAFVINVYGAIDNLAWLWVWEAEVKCKGRPIRSKFVGLTPGNKVVRESLSVEMQDYMSGMNAWFGYLENYRHALAHRVPLYIPPKHMDNDAAAEWRRLETESLKALQLRDFDLFGELKGQQEQLGAFQPSMMHAYGPDKNDGTPVPFHGQIISDLATVVEIGEKILRELKSLPKEA